MNDRDRFIAYVQALLTFLLVLSFIYLLVAGKMDAATALKDWVGIGVMFWLMRHRAAGASADEPDAPETPPPSTVVQFPNLKR